MFSVGPGEVAIIFGLALLIFGPKKLPDLGRALGQGIGNFKKGLTDAQHELKTALEASNNETNKAETASDKASERS